MVAVKSDYRAGMLGYMNVNIRDSQSLLVWVLQTGEPLHIDGQNAQSFRVGN